MDVDKFLERAEVALRKRNPPQAVALYRQVLRAEPGHAGARLGTLRAYARKAELKGGPSLFDRSAAKGMSAAAKGMATANKPAAVVKSCEAGLEKNPADAGLLAMLAQALEDLGHGESALSVWRFRLEQDDQDLDALKGAGKLHYKLRQITEAVECFERAHALDKHDPEVERLRKNLAAEGTLASTRFESAKSSRELVKDKAALRGGERAARLHRTSDELSDDIETLEARLAEKPDDVDGRRRLTRALVAGRRWDQALAHLEAWTAADEHGLAADELADLTGEVQLARAEADLVAAKGAGDAAALAEAADARARLEAAEYGRRVAADPSLTELRLKLARALYRLKETDKAIEHFQVLAGDHRLKLDAQQGLGACFFRKGLLPLAARQFESALALAGGVTQDRGKEICYHLGLVCERMGDTSGALSRYLEIYEVDINFKDVGQKIETLKS